MQILTLQTLFTKQKLVVFAINLGTPMSNYTIFMQLTIKFNLIHNLIIINVSLILN